ALSTFRQVLEARPESIPVLERMEALCTELERWPELADALAKRIQLAAQQAGSDPKLQKELVELKFRLAQVREGKLMDKRAAMEVYAEIIAADPKHAGVVQRLEAALE